MYVRALVPGDFVFSTLWANACCIFEYVEVEGRLRSLRCTFDATALSTLQSS